MEEEMINWGSYSRETVAFSRTLNRKEEVNFLNLSGKGQWSWVDGLNGMKEGKRITDPFGNEGGLEIVAWYLKAVPTCNT